MADAIASAFEWIVDTGSSALEAVGFSEATADAVSEAVVEAAATAALSAAVGAITQPDVGAEGTGREWRRDPNAGIPYVAGFRGVGGLIVHSDEFGSDNRFMGYVTLLSGGAPIQGFGNFNADSVPVSFNGSGEAQGDYSGRMWRQIQLGAQPEAGILTQSGLHGGAMLDNWTASHKLSGKAADLWVLDENSKQSFWRGAGPTPVREIYGIKWYDPRKDSTYPGGSGAHRLGQPSTYEYSTNGAIHALGYALGIHENGRLVEGIGCPVEEIDIEAHVELANVADLNGWECNAHWTSRDRKHQVYTGFLQAAGGRFARKGGKMSCVARSGIKTSVATLSAADTAGPVQVRAMASSLDRVNTILPKCVLRDHDWQLVDLDPVDAAAYITEDGGNVRERGVSYPFVTDAAQAAQLAAYDIADSREGLSASFPALPKHLDLQVGDAVTITESEFNLDGQKFLVMGRTLDTATGVPLLKLVSETDAKHAWALGLSPTPPAAPAISYTPPAPIDPPADDFTATPVSNPVDDGTTRPGVLVTGVVASVGVTNYRSDVRVALPDGQGGFLDWSPWRTYGEYPADTTQFFIEGFPSGAKVEPRLTYIDKFGQPSANPRALGEHIIPEFIATGAVIVGNPNGAPGTFETAAAIINRVTEADDAAAAAQDEIDQTAAAILAGADDLVTAMQALKGVFDAGAGTLGDAASNRLGSIDAATSSLASDILSQARDTEAVRVEMAVALASVSQVIEASEELSAGVGEFQASFESQVTLLSSDVAALSAQVSAWTAANVTGDIASALTDEINARVAGDTANATRINGVETVAQDAQAKANDILALTVSPGSALAQRFSGFDLSVAAAQSTANTGVADAAVAQATADAASTAAATAQTAADGAQATAAAGVTAAATAQTTADAAASAASTAQSAADSNTLSINAAVEAQLSANNARIRDVESALASVAAGWAAFQTQREVQLSDSEVQLQLIEAAQAAIGANAAGIASIINFEVDGSSALAQEFGALTAAAAAAQSTADGAASSAAAAQGSADAANAGVAVNTAAITSAVEVQASADQARVRDLERTLASVAAAFAAMEVQRELQADESEAFFRAIEQAEVGIAANLAAFSSIINLDVDPGSSLAQEFSSLTSATGAAQSAADGAQTAADAAQSAAAGAQATADGAQTAADAAQSAAAGAQATADGAASAAASAQSTADGAAGAAAVNAAAITSANEARTTGDRALTRSVESALAQLAVGVAAARQLVETAASESETAVALIENAEASLNGAIASLNETKLSRVDFEAEFETAFSSYSLTINTVLDTVDGHLTTLDTDVGDLALDLGTNYNTAAEAALLFRTESQVNTQIADYNVLIGASNATIAAWLTQHAGALTTLQGDAEVVYSLRLGVGDRVLGLYATNDGTTRSVVWDVDSFIIYDGTSDVTAFALIDGVIYLENIQVRSGQISDLVVDKITGGALGADINIGAGGLIRLNNGLHNLVELGALTGAPGVAGLRVKDQDGTIVIDIRNDAPAVIQWAVIQGVQIQEADIADATIGAIKLKSGAIGAMVSASQAVHDFYDGILDPSLVSSFDTLQLVTPWMTVEAGALLRVRLKYDLEAEYGAYDWFTFRDLMVLEARYAGQSGSDVFAQTGIAGGDGRNLRSGRSSSSAPQLAGFTPTYSDQFADTLSAVAPATVSGQPIAEVRGVIYVAAKGISTSLTCAINPNQTSMGNTLKLTDVLVEVEKFSSGFTVT